MIVPTTSLKLGLAMSMVMAMATIPAATVAPVLRRRCSAEILLPLLSILSIGCILIAKLLLQKTPVLIESLGLYFPLAAINSMMVDLAAVHPRETVGESFADSVKMSLGFTLAACSIAALREILGSRTLWGLPFHLYPLEMRGVLLPFFGFILIGFLNAGFRTFDRFYRGRILQRGNLSAKEDK